MCGIAVSSSPALFVYSSFFGWQYFVKDDPSWYYGTVRLRSPLYIKVNIFKSLDIMENDYTISDR